MKTKGSEHGLFSAVTCRLGTRWVLRGSGAARWWRGARGCLCLGVSPGGGCRRDASDGFADHEICPWGPQVLWPGYESVVFLLVCPAFVLPVRPGAPGAHPQSHPAESWCSSLSILRACPWGCQERRVPCVVSRETQVSVGTQQPPVQLSWNMLGIYQLL